MLIALDDVEAREPFLKEVMQWKQQSKKIFRNLLATTTVEAMEQHWGIIKDGLFPIAYSSFAVNDKSPRKPWASDELAELTLEKQKALKQLDQYCIVWTALTRARADLFARAERDNEVSQSELARPRCANPPHPLFSWFELWRLKQIRTRFA